ncbi:UDP-N-acetylglucosamine transporter-like isoform X4 [Dermacentor variabilis]|uniref:UDP-N-acetylglucosamine transporter-like isoform X4 n=1 Tax=Dermacentor variabilis TaxID=34621 RepID=UPI003F5BE865
MKEPAPPPERKKMANALKYTSLVFIVVQTTAMVLLLRYSRTQAVQGPRYLSSTAVVCAEFLKILTCIAVLLWENGFSVPALVLQLRNEVWRQPKETCKMLVPAGLYTVQNNLLFFALSLLDAATYQVTYQLKILTTAMFSVWMLKRRISKQQWSSLVLLIIGVALVQMPTEEEAPGTTAKQGSYQFLGLIAVLISCLSSGFSGIYLEKLLKEITWSLWIRNIQLDRCPGCGSSPTIFHITALQTSFLPCQLSFTPYATKSCGTMPSATDLPRSSEL